MNSSANMREEFKVYAPYLMWSKQYVIITTIIIILRKICISADLKYFMLSLMYNFASANFFRL